MGNKCVNKDKFFKETAKRLNINEGLLDLIVYAYINNEQLQLEGHEDFPTDNYIIALLSGKNYVSEKALKKATKLWETYYSKPIITGSKEKALSYRNAALKYFSHEAIVMYQGQDGTWIINVGQPQNENEKPSSFGKITKSLKEQYREKLIQFYTTQSKDAIDYSVNRMLSTISKVKSFIGGLNKKLTYSTADVDKMNLILHTIKSNSLYRSILKENPYIYNHKSGGKKLQVSFLNEDAIKEKAKQEAIKQIESFVKSLPEEQLISEIQLLNADEGIMFHLSNKQRQELQSKLPKTLIYTDTEIDSLIEELSALENTPENNLFVKTLSQWAQLNRIRIPLDITKCRQLFDTARQKGWDIQLFRSPIHILERIIQEDTDTPANSVDMANYPKCTYNTTIVTDEGSIDIYDVEDSPEGQQNVCQILADASPKNVTGRPILESPWCLSTFNYNTETKVATPTSSARRFWGSVYTAIPKLIALHNGFPIGFRASNHGIEWWNWYDSPSDTLNSYFIRNKEEQILHANDRQHDMSLGKTLYYNSLYPGANFYGVTYQDFYGHNYEEYLYQLTQLLNNNTDIYIPELYTAIHGALNTLNKKIDSLRVEAMRTGTLEFIETANFIKNELLPKIQEFLDTLPSIKSIEKELKKSPKASLRYTPSQLYTDSALLKSIKDAILERLNILRNSSKPKQTPIDNVSKKTLNQLNTEVASILEYAQENDFEDVEAQEEHVLDEAYYDVFYDDWDIETPNPQEEEYTELEVPVNPMEDTPITADTVVTALHILKDRVIAEQFNEYIEKPFMKDLEKILRGILEKYHFETIEGDLREAFGEDTLGAFDALQKIIYLANEGDRNALTYPEEFAHAFIKMMGATYRREENRERFPENKLYSELRDLLAQTEFYKEVYEQYKDVYKFENGKPDTPRILEEAMGKALALSLVKKFEAKKDKKFFDKLKDWFNKVLQSFKKLFSTEVEEKSLEQSLLEEMDKIADSILNGSYAKKYLDKIDSTNHQLMDYADTILNQTRKDGGRALSIMQRLSSVGGIISGSLALRKQGTIYRASQDTLHDIDVMFSPDVEGSLFNVLPNINRFDTFWTPERLKSTINSLPFYQNLKQQIPGLHLISAFHTDAGVLGSAVVCDNEELVQKFANMTGNYASRLAQLTQEERDQLYIIDLMFNNSNYVDANSIHDADNEINLANYTVPFKFKLKMGRAKDLFDYLMYRPVNRNYKVVGQDVLYQKKQTKEEPVQEVTVDVTLGSTKKTYTVKGDKIYNTKGDEVFKADAANAGADRNKILANVAVKLGKAVVVDHKGRKYVVHDDNTIISGTTGKKMLWDETNGDRIAILDSATKKKEEKKNKALIQKEKDKCLFYSGGAYGADLLWGDLLQKAGYKIWHILTYDFRNATEEYKDYIDKLYRNIAVALDRTILEINFEKIKKNLDNGKDPGELVRRSVMQAEYADSIIGVAPIVWPGQKNSRGYYHKLNYPMVDGGTAYATFRGIQRGLPVYIYDLKTNTWNAWAYSKKAFVVVEEPTLTPNAALIGSRSTERLPNTHPAIQAMQSVVNKGVKSVQEKPIDIQKEVKETPKVFTGNMYFAYGSEKAEGITAETTLEAIQKGERTATTRYAKDGNIDYWKNAKVGDIIEWSDKKGNKVRVRVTKELTLLPKDTTSEEWSAKEGWNKDHFNKRVKPRIEAGEAYQIEFELVETPKANTKTYSGKITSLKPNQVFVFGSNTLGRHGAGAAKTAKDNFGATYGLASGPQGQSYAIITKDLTKDDKKNPSRTKEQIIEEIRGLYEYAKANPDKEFLVAYSSTGKNLNHYTNEQMAEMFASLAIPSNIVFEEGFSKLVYSNPVPSNKEIKGENISSKGSPLARKLTNPGNDLTVQYKGRTFRNAEHAYLTWKSGEFDNDAYESKAYKPRGKKPVNKATNFQTMVDILTAKFKQHPDLVLEVEAAGGMEYLEKCTHDVIGDLYWEKDGNFIKALKLAYSNVSTLSKTEKAHNEIIEILGGADDSRVQQEVKDVVAVAKKGISFEEALSKVVSIFTKEEIKLIKEAIKNTPKKRLTVMSVSRRTDPAFFSKDIIKVLEQLGKKSFSDPTRINVIELWSKHDGEPIQDILKACKKYKVAPMVSFSITGLGNTALEKGVLSHKDLLPLIKKLIKSGDLDPSTTTIRLDPILVGVTKMEDIEYIVKECKAMGIKKFVTSLVQSYGYYENTPYDRKVISGINNALAKEGKTYDWDKYYGRNRKGQINFIPKQEHIDEIGKVLLRLNEDPEIKIETCSFIIKGLKASACLDPMIIERLVGVDVTRPDGTYDRDTSRKECMCYAGHSDVFAVKEKDCYSSCAYCYAAHSEDNAFDYYNEDGTLKDIPLTRVVGNDNLIVASNGMVFNREQSAAIRAVVQHIKDVLSGKTDNRVITIQGKAGTGKTTIINEIIKRCNIRDGSTIGISALAHKAKLNLYDKIDDEVKKNYDVSAHALAGLLGKKLNTDTGEFEAGFSFKEPPISSMSLLFIDEASMVNESELDTILDLAPEGMPIIFLGDIGQLPPIREDKNEYAGKPAPVFTEGYPVVHLVERVRQGEESPVLDFADKYWDFSQLENLVYPNEADTVTTITSEGALIITDLNNKNPDGSIKIGESGRLIPNKDGGRKRLAKSLLTLYEQGKEKQDSFKVKIVAYRNATIDDYNHIIMKELFPMHDEKMGYPVDACIIFNAPYAEPKKGNTKSSNLADNSTEGIIIHAKEPLISKSPLAKDLGLEDILTQEVVIKLLNDSTITAKVLVRTPENLATYNRNLEHIAEIIKRGFPVKFQGQEKILKWDVFFSYKEDLADIRYSYAITAHKSQGSTYEVVVVDTLDINSVSTISNKEKALAIYTGLTRASNVTIVLGRDTSNAPVQNIEDINALIIEAKAKKKAEKPTVQESIKEVEDKLEVVDTRNAHLDSIEAQSGQEDIINEAPVLEFTPDEMEGINPSSQPIFNRDIEDAEYEDIDNTENAYTFDPRMDEKEPTIAVESLLSDAELELQSLMANTIHNEFLTQEEFKELALDVVFTVSDYINQIINDNASPNKKDLSVKLFGVDTTGMTRRQVVKAIGINNLYEFAKKMILNPNNLKLSERAKDAIETVEDNWEAVCMLGFETLAKQEGLSARFIKANKKVEETDSLDAIDPDEIQDTSSSKKSDDYVNDDEIISDESSDNTDNDGVVDKDDAEGHVEAFGSKQEKWQVESKTISIEQSLTQRMRNKFSQYSDLDESGNVQYNMWGIRKRIPVEIACKKLSHWLNQALSFSEMKAILKKKEMNNPWIALLLRDLENDVDFAGEFYVNFCKHRANLAIITTENGRTDSLMVNSNLGRKQVMKELQAKFSLNSCTLCTANPKLDGGSVNPEAIKALEKYKKELSTLSFGKNTSSEDLKDNLLEASETLAAIYEEVFDIKISAKNIYAVLTPEHIKTAISAITGLSTVKAFREKNPFESSKKPGKIYTEVSNLLLPYIEVVEETINDSVHDNGKTYQSKIIPSWLSKLFVKFTKDGDTFLDTIKKEYGPSEFFVLKDKIKNEDSYKDPFSWRIPYVVRILQDKYNREVLKHVTVLHADNARYYKGMNEHQYFISTVVQFLTGYSSGTGWFRVPLQSNKPSNEFIQMTLDNSDKYQENLAGELYYVFGQELSRIQTVTLRAKAVEEGKLPKSSLISNWDERGKSFCFLPCFNKYLNDTSTELGLLIKLKIDGKKLSKEQEATLLRLAKQEITDYINSRATACIEQWKSQGLTNVINARLKHKFPKDDVDTMLRKFVWNDTYAAINILELTVGDIAFYGNTADLQKRLAQLHAPGVRGNTEIKDYKGNSVCDGKIRHITLADESINSMIIENLKVVFSKRAAQIKNKEEKKRFEQMVETILDTYKGITATDGQALACPTSYRKKGLIFGKWSRTKEAAYEKLLDGTYTYADLESLFPPTKPFAYGHSFKSTRVGNAPISQVKVNTQLKNSEYLLVLAEALMSNLDENKPNLLRAIYNVMEESAKKDITKGIDTVVFVSNVKTGISEVIDINNAKTTEEAEEILRKAIYNEDGSYTEAVVELDAEDYSIQQDLPDHYRNHDLAMGSQFRYGVIADIAYAFDEIGEVGYYIEGRGDVSPEEFKQHFEEVVSENIEEDLKKVAKSLGVSKGSIVELNVAISRLLQLEILDNPRYGLDLFWACGINKDTGNFNVPLADPTHKKRVQQLLNSILRNRINKQTMPGGPVVQVANYGTSKKLAIRFKDRKGNILPTKEEYIAKNMLDKTGLTYQEYMQKNQYAPAYYECMVPVPGPIYRFFVDPKTGLLNIDRVKKHCPQLLDVISYRIPTEDKYSMIPGKVVGIVPAVAGEVIIYPDDLVNISGIDFDSDKLYTMHKHFKCKRKYKTLKDLKALMMVAYGDYKRLEAAKNGKEWTEKDLKELEKKVERFVRNPEDITWRDSSIFDIYLDTCLSFIVPSLENENSRLARDNRLFDMSYEILTHPAVAHLLLNPGSFESQKKQGYLTAAFKIKAQEIPLGANRRQALKLLWEELSAKKIKDLKSILDTVNDNLIFIDTLVQYYKLNAAAGTVLGIFAVAKTAHCVFEGQGIYLVTDDMPEVHFLGNKYGGKDSEIIVDPTTNSNGEYIGKVLGSLVSSSADAVKDPVLNLMNINQVTANVLIGMIRVGIPFEHAAMLLSQDIILRVLDKYNKAGLEGYSTLQSALAEVHNEIAKGYTSDSDLYSEDLTMEELIEGLTSDSSEKTKIKALLVFTAMHNLGMKVSSFSTPTRLNSIKDSVGPFVVDNYIKRIKLGDFPKAKKENKEYTLSDVFKDHPILSAFFETVKLSDYLLRLMPESTDTFKSAFARLTLACPKVKFTDKTMLNKFIEFYQSYILVHNGVIDPEEAQKLLKTIPASYRKEIKKKYAGNALIDALTLDIDKKGNSTVRLNVSGLSEAEKSKLKAAWTTLHRENPELSRNLFLYNFIRGGIGFNPKTFMAIFPDALKVEIKGYRECFEKEPSFTPKQEAIMLDLFVRNNTKESKLWTTLKEKELIYPDKDNKSEFLTSTFNGPAYVKIYSWENKKLVLKLYRKVPARVSPYDPNLGEHYKEISALGGNGQFLEISSNNVRKSISNEAVSLDETPEMVNDEPITTTAQEERISSEKVAALVGDANNDKDARVNHMMNLIENNLKKKNIEVNPELNAEIKKENNKRC